MEPTAATRLRALGWTAIVEGLRDVAATWARLCVDRLPVKDRNLESLQRQYRELMESMPVSEPEEIAVALRQFTRALRLKGDDVSATQRRYLEEHSGLRHLATARRAAFEIRSVDGADEYFRPILNNEGSGLRAISAGALFYAVAHRSLGALFPTFTEAFRERLRELSLQPGLADASGCLGLEPLIEAHSHWLGQLLNQTKAASLVLAAADSPDYSAYDEEETTGSWLDDVVQEIPAEDDETEWPQVSAGRHHRARHGIS